MSPSARLAVAATLSDEAPEGARGSVEMNGGMPLVS